MKPTLLEKGLLFFALMLAALHVYLVATHSINVPFSDDFDQQLRRFYVFSEGMWGFWEFLTRQHNEHKLLTTHALTLITFNVFGAIDIQAQIVFSSLVLVLLVWVMGKCAPKEFQPWLIAICACLMFVPMRNSIWLGGSLQYYSVTLFSVACLLILDRMDRPLYFVLSIAFFFLAVFSMASGVVLIVPCLMMIVLSVKARLSLKIAWAILALCSLYLFFDGYRFLEDKPSTLYFLENPRFTIEYGLMLLGNPLQETIPPHVFRLPLAFALIALAIVMVWKTRISDYINNKIFYIVLYLAMVLGLVVLGRAGYEDIITSSSPRYQIYVKALWVSGIALLCSLRLMNKPLLIIGLVGCLFYFFDNHKNRVHRIEESSLNLSMAMSEMIFEQKHTGLEYGTKTYIASRNTIRSMVAGQYHPRLRESESLPWQNVAEQNLPVIVLSDKKFNQYRRLAFTLQTDKPVTLLVSDNQDSTKKAAFLARNIRFEVNRPQPQAGKFEVLFDQSQYQFNDSISIVVLVDGKPSAAAIGDTSIRLPGSLKEYASRD